MKSHFLTYASGAFLENAENLAASALRCGFETASVLTPEALAGTEFEKRNKGILSAKRGAGYWLWKPYIILKQVEKLKKNECVFYSDAGRTPYYEFSSYPRNLINLMQNNNRGYLLGCSAPHLGSIEEWTKSDCIEIMSKKQCVDTKAALIMTWSVWENSEEAVSFLKEWIKYAEDKRCLTDIPNELGVPNSLIFKEHRFDQSIMSILAQRYSSPHIDVSSTSTQWLISRRPGSELANTFYKRPQNAEDMISGFGLLLLVREYFRLLKCRKH